MPAPSPVLLTRQRLHDLLDADTSRLTVIAGPSGFGKTSLVRAWVHAMDDADLIWVTLESDLESRSAFWQTVLAGAGRLGVMDGPAPMIEVENSPDPAAVIARGISSSQRPLLVVDAYEKVREMTAQVDADLMRLASLVPHLRIVVTTRTSSGLASPARSLRGEVQLLTEEDLAFSVGETRELLATFAEPGLVDATERLHEATRGYPLALRAAMLSLARTRNLPGNQPGNQQLAWQVLVAEDLRVQLGEGPVHDFVLATSVPPYFDSELAIELTARHSHGVTGPAEVKQVLDDLEWNGFGRWIPFAPGRQVFQYVESLRDAMLAEAQQRPPTEQTRAAEASAMWLHRHGSHEAALEMAVAAGLFGIAARVYAAVVVTNQDAISSSLVDRHLASVPSRALTQFPALAFGRGLACYRDPSLRGAAADYFKITAAWDGPRFPNPTAGEYLLGYIAKVVSLRLLGRIEESARVAEQTLEFYESMLESDREQLAPLRPMALRHLGYTQFLAGHLEAARSTTMRAVAVATQPAPRNHTAVYAIGPAAIEGWVKHARSAQALIDPNAWRPGEDRTYAGALGRIGEAALRLDDFDFAGAVASYDGCESFRDTSEFWPFLTWTLLHARIGLDQAAAEAQRVEEQLQRHPAPPGMSDNLGSAMVRAGLALAWLAAGNRGKATPHLRARTKYDGQLAPAVLLARLLAGDAADALVALPGLEDRNGHTVRSTAALLTLGAAAAARAGREETAASLLQRVLAQVAPGGARLHLMYLPSEDLAALRRIASTHTTDDVAAHLTGPVPTIFSGETSVVSLTNQERAVVAAMVHHATRSEVAAALHVSENTVKTHLQRIYRKLGVNSRNAVIDRAIELDLLEHG